MRFRRAFPLLLTLLPLVGCSDREITSYRVPKEKLPEPPPASSASANPHGHGHGHGHGSAVAGAGLAWDAPAGWQEKPASGFRRGSFSIPGPDGAEADLSIISFPGTAGGMTENFNRWRAQLGLPPGSEDEINAAVQHLDSRGGLHLDVVNYVGSVGDARTRILGAVTEFGGESWFFKLMGPDALVATAAPAFLEFLQTVRPATP